MNDLTKNFVFLSYSHKDDNIKELVDWFANNGINVVYDDRLLPGDEWDIEVRKYLGNVKCVGVLLIMSKFSIVSKPVMNEVEIATNKRRPFVCISADGLSFAQLYSSVRDIQVDRIVASEIKDNLPDEKIYVSLREVLDGRDTKLMSVLNEWDVYVDHSAFDFSNISKIGYFSDLKGEKERLENQQQAYMSFDEKAINKVVNRIGRDELVVLDLGCSNGKMTYSRFKDSRFAKVIGVDIDENALAVAKEANYGDKFYFDKLDLLSDNLGDDLNELLKRAGVEKVDIVMLALTLQHVAEPVKVLSEAYSVLSDDGYVVIRGSDDGSKLCYPESELMTEFLLRHSKLVSTDRFNGRKLFGQLTKAGFENISMMYDVVDTCGMKRKDREALYNIGFSFRREKILKILDENAAKLSKAQKEELEWQLSALEKIRLLFNDNNFWYSNVLYIAFANKG